MFNSPNKSAGIINGVEEAPQDGYLYSRDGLNETWVKTASPEDRGIVQIVLRKFVDAVNMGSGLDGVWRTPNGATDGPFEFSITKQDPLNNVIIYCATSFYFKSVASGQEMRCWARWRINDGTGGDIDGNRILSAGISNSASQSFMDMTPQTVHYDTSNSPVIKVTAQVQRDVAPLTVNNNGKGWIMFQEVKG